MIGVGSGSRAIHFSGQLRSRRQDQVARADDARPGVAGCQEAIRNCDIAVDCPHTGQGRAVVDRRVRGRRTVDHKYAAIHGRGTGISVGSRQGQLVAAFLGQATSALNGPRQRVVADVVAQGQSERTQVDRRSDFAIERVHRDVTTQQQSQPVIESGGFGIGSLEDTDRASSLRRGNAISNCRERIEADSHGPQPRTDAIRISEAAGRGEVVVHEGLGHHANGVDRVQVGSSGQWPRGRGRLHRQFVETANASESIDGVIDVPVDHSRDRVSRDVQQEDPVGAANSRQYAVRDGKLITQFRTASTVAREEDVVHIGEDVAVNDQAARLRGQHQRIVEVLRRRPQERVIGNGDIRGIIVVVAVFTNAVDIFRTIGRSTKLERIPRDYQAVIAGAARCRVLEAVGPGPEDAGARPVAVEREGVVEHRLVEAGSQVHTEVLRPLSVSVDLSGVVLDRGSVEGSRAETQDKRTLKIINIQVFDREVVVALNPAVGGEQEGVVETVQQVALTEDRSGRTGAGDRQIVDTAGHHDTAGVIRCTGVGAREISGS